MMGHVDIVSQLYEVFLIATAIILFAIIIGPDNDDDFNGDDF